MALPIKNQSAVNKNIIHPHQSTHTYFIHKHISFATIVILIIKEET
jgi:hypothetical protein